jgi:hypothetical protein
MASLFEIYERRFLESKATEWGWAANSSTAKIFIQRMLDANSGLTHVEIVQKLNIVNAKGHLVPNAVADALNGNIMPKLREAGCPEGNWKAVQNWLHETVFFEWIKPPFAWQALWALTKPNPDIAVEIIQKPLVAGMGIPDDYEPYQVPIGANVRYQIPMAEGEYLILLEKDGNGDIYCLQPSRHQKYKVGEPIATSELIAIVSPEKPAVDWWEAAASGKGFLPIQPQQIESLMNWTNNARNDCRLWQFEVEIVMPKIEPVVTVTF